MTRLRLALAPLLAVAATFPSCRCGRTTPSADLVVATFAEHDALARTVVGRWQAAHPEKTIELLSLPAGDFYSAMLPRIYTGTGVPDLVLVDAPFLARTGGAGFEDLRRPPYDAGAALLPALAPQAVAAGRAPGGAQLGVPLATSPVLLFYRRDVLARAAVPDAELSASWERLVEAGRKVKSATGAYLTPQVGDLVFAALLSRTTPGGSAFLVPGEEVALRRPAFEEAIGLARALRAAELAGGMGRATQEWGKAVRGGLLLTDLAGPTALRQLAFTAPETAGAWRAVAPPAPLPADAVFAALPARGRHALAWDVVRTALTPEGQHADFADATAYPALLAAQADPLLDEPVPFLGGQRLGGLWRDALARAPALVPSRRDAVVAGAFVVAMDQVTERGRDVREALADAEADARKRLARMPQ